MTDPAEEPGRLTRLSAIAAASASGDALERVLDAAIDVAPRSALFLVRSGRLRGWRCLGYEDACRRRIERLDLDCAHGWLAPLLDASGPRLVARGAGEHTPDFGQLHAEDALATALRAGTATIALLLVERFRGQQPWDPAGLGTLGLLGGLRLALDVASRRPGPPPATQAPEVIAPDDARPFTADVPSPRPETESGLVPVEEAEPTRQAPARRRDARRFARLVASDIRLYNEEAVLTGRTHRDLGIRLERALARGRQSFLRRFPDLGRDGLRILDEAYVEVLAGGDADLLRDGIQSRQA